MRHKLRLLFFSANSTVRWWGFMHGGLWHRWLISHTVSSITYMLASGCHARTARRCNPCFNIEKKSFLFLPYKSCLFLKLILLYYVHGKSPLQVHYLVFFRPLIVNRPRHLGPSLLSSFVQRFDQQVLNICFRKNCWIAPKHDDNAVEYIDNQYF